MPSPEEKQRIDYRSKAHAHVRAAREMLKSDDAFASTYACLRARFAIEALAYDQLQDYLSEVSPKAKKEWTPKAVLKELLYADPDACSPVNPTISWRPDPAAPPQVIHLGESYPLSLGWAHRMHNALGNFLHQPTIRQMETGEPESDRQHGSRKKAEEALQGLDRVLGSLGFRVHRPVKARCECGSLIVRDLDFLNAGKAVMCSNCDRLYNYRFDERRDGFEFWPRQALFTCPDCKTVNSMDAYEFKPGKVLECSGCGVKFEAETMLGWTRIVSGTDNPTVVDRSV
jgi:transcription elongation factor Elf1